jgi:hypothetical protein
MSAASTGPKGNRMMCDKSQFFSQIGIYEMHNRHIMLGSGPRDLFDEHEEQAR